MWPGQSFPLGATTSAAGTNFAIFSAAATQVTLCLFDDAQTETRLPLTEVDSFVWHGFVPGVGHGQRYGYRVDGPWDLNSSTRCDPAKLLLDPIPYPDATGKLVIYDDFLVLFNAWWQPLAMTVPLALGGTWTVELDSSQVTGVSGTATEVG
ncbi:MAG TPA: hypothetical protein VGI66_05890, partial [Streptosporangiaceae bacterium]